VVAWTQFQRTRLTALTLDSVALTLMIVGGLLGTSTTSGLALFITGIVLVQVAWVPVLFARRLKRMGPPSVHRVDSEGNIRDL
jgi:hypothetical protein